VTQDERSRIDEICLRNLLDTPAGIFFFKDLDGHFLKVSVDCARLTNRTPEEMVGLSDRDLTDAAHAAELHEDEQMVIRTGLPLIDKEEADRLANQPGTWVETSKFPLRDDDGTIIGTFGYSRDVTRWELAERRLVEVEAQLRAVFDASTDAIARYDRYLRYQFLNRAGEEMRRVAVADLLGRTDHEVGGQSAVLDTYVGALERVLASGVHEEIELNFTRDEVERWFHISIAPILDADGESDGVLASMRDISELKRAERALKLQALHDPLTGLANRYRLMDRLGEAIVRLGRQPGLLALLFIDVDQLKDVNDTYGHEVGDRVLVDVARRLERVGRREDTVARLGGDEFVLLCDHATLDISTLADRVVHALAEPYEDGELSFPLSASVGAVVTDNTDANAMELLQVADTAMYRAKSGGRNRFEIVGSVALAPRSSDS
jgi:diguanylate cyclase (GGDEF)-like protein/PAS domain S-box-containing protein